MTDITVFVEGLRQSGLPNEQAVWIGYAVQCALDEKSFKVQCGTFGMRELSDVVKCIENRAK